MVESLTPPDVILIENDPRMVGDKLNRYMASLNFHVKMPVYRNFQSIDPVLFNEEFKHYVENGGLPWAVWKCIGIRNIMRLAMSYYFHNKQMTVSMNAWKKLGEMVLENIYSAHWKKDGFEKNHTAPFVQTQSTRK